MFSRFVLFLMLCGCDENSSSNVKPQQNLPPEAVITSHSDGAVFISGESIEFIGAVTDAEDTSEQLQVVWYSGADVLCPSSAPDENGLTICTMDIAADMTDIRLDVIDSEGSESSAAIAIEVTTLQAPSVNVLSPVDGGGYYADDAIVFEAEIEDSEDTASELSHIWTSSVGGELPLSDPPDSDGILSQTLSLVSGLHDITLTVGDSDGQSTSQTVSIVVQGINEAPNCSVSSPANFAIFEQGSPIIFEGNVADVNQGPEELLVEWSSSIGGVFANPEADQNGLSSLEYAGLGVGAHVIAFTVTDDRGLTCTETREITVGMPPSVTISTPVDGVVFSLGSAIAFSAVVSDVIDTPNQLDLSWSSSLEGVLSTQGATVNGTVDFVRSDLSVGLHDIVFQAGNSSGFSSEASLQIRVNTPPSEGLISFSPNPVYTNDDVAGTPINFIDSDGDTIAYTYEWFQDGSPTIFTGDTIPSSATSEGERWTLRITPNDGYVDGPFVESFIDIFAAGPSVYSLSISPNTGVTTGLTLSCNASATDSSQGVLTPAYQWTVNGQNVSSSNIYTVNTQQTDPGDVITCTAIATNGNGVSVSASTTVMVENTDPIVTGVGITPSTVNNDDVVQCSATVVDPDETPAVLFVWHESMTPIGSGISIDLATAAIYPGDALRCYAFATDAYGGTNSAYAEVIVEQRPPTDPIVVISPVDPEPGVDDLLCSASGSSDPDGLPLTYSFTWTSSSGAVEYSDTVPGILTSGGETWTCTVEVSDGDAVTVVSESVDISSGGFAQGEVMRVDGSWVDVSFEFCGSSGTCNANAAKAACTAIGKKVVSHGSNGTNEVYSLGATNSCNWSISYYQVFQSMPGGSCLVGISNLEWSTCCGTSSWHGNTRVFGSANSVFGYVYSSNSGYQSQYSNQGGAGWGCTSESTAASNSSNCSDHYVACAN